MTVWGLRCCVGFSLVAASVGALSSCGAWTSRCGAKALGHAGSVVVVLRGTWGLPGPQIEPVSPALVSNFFTTEPSGKPMLFLKKKKITEAKFLIYLYPYSTSDILLDLTCVSQNLAFLIPLLAYKFHESWVNSFHLPVTRD